MKLLLVISLATLSLAGRLDHNYLPPNNAASSGGSNFLSTPQQSYSQNSNIQTGPPVAILRQNNENNGDGTYRFDFETENRISQQESGQLKNAGSQDESNSVQGSYSYTGLDGQTISLNYVADENGFQPVGDHLPTAPPIPAEILEALQKNAADEAAGIVDDGQYRPDPSEGVSGYRAQQGYSNQNQGQYQQQRQYQQQQQNVNRGYQGQQQQNNREGYRY